MADKILVTGSSGLIGSVLRPTLEARGFQTIGFDLRGGGCEFGDVCDVSGIEQAVLGCQGIIHLAAVSRVIWGEQDPERCKAVNLGGLRNVLSAALSSSHRPWVIFASSREVYGQPHIMPTPEDSPLLPVNIYGHTKVDGEGLINEARNCGLKASIIRLSNVFGRTTDHHDRVVPAFARQALAGEVLRVDGADHTFDFTYVDDVAQGIATLAELLGTLESAPPPIHFVSGIPTTLGELAHLAIQLAGGQASMRTSAPRNFDVARFYGDPSRAREILGWQSKVHLRDGLQRLIQTYRAEQLLQNPRNLQ